MESTGRGRGCAMIDPSILIVIALFLGLLFIYGVLSDFQRRHREVMEKLEKIAKALEPQGYKHWEKQRCK